MVLVNVIFNECPKMFHPSPPKPRHEGSKGGVLEVRQLHLPEAADELSASNASNCFCSELQLKNIEQVKQPGRVTIEPCAQRAFS